jgi:sugar phosphate isomerase/epimerase
VPTKGRIKQSLAHWCLTATHCRWDIHRVCRTAKELGCAAVELAPFEDWATVREYGLEMPLAHNGMADPVFAKGLNNPRYQEEVIATTKKVMDLCAEHGVANVIAFTGYHWRDADDPSSPIIPREEGAANTVKGLRELARYGEARGVTVVMEHLNTRDDSHPMKGHPGYQGDDIDYCAEIIRAVGSPRAKLLFDVYHVAIMNGDVIRRLKQYRDLLGHIHVAGVPGRAELDETQEIHFPAVMRALVEIGYSGYVGLEFIPTGEPEKSLAQAVAACDV